MLKERQEKKCGIEHNNMILISSSWEKKNVSHRKRIKKDSKPTKKLKKNSFLPVCDILEECKYTKEAHVVTFHTLFTTEQKTFRVHGPSKLVVFPWGAIF